MCAEAYGLTDYSGPDTLRAATDYGGRQIAATNVTFVNGNADPWHALSVVNASDQFYNACTPGEPACTNQSLKSTSDAVVELVGTAHCRDMYAPGALEPAGINDTASVVWAHQVITARVAGYVGAAAQ